MLSWFGIDRSQQVLPRMTVYLYFMYSSYFQNYIRHQGVNIVRIKPLYCKAVWIDIDEKMSRIPGSSRDHCYHKCECVICLDFESNIEFLKVFAKLQHQQGKQTTSFKEVL